METLITSLYAMFVVLGNVAQVGAWLLIVTGPAFLLGTGVYKLATMNRGNDSFKKGSSRTEMEARARIYEQQLKHRNNIR